MPKNRNKASNIDRNLVAAVDVGLREAFKLKKFLMSDIAAEVDNPPLNPTHYRTLMHLDSEGPSAMKSLCGRIGLEAGSFTPVADRLIADELVRRDQDPRDRRKNVLSLTPKGEAKVERLRRTVRRHIREKLSVLDDTEVADLVRALSVIGDVNQKLQGLK